MIRGGAVGMAASIQPSIGGVDAISMSTSPAQLNALYVRLRTQLINVNIR